MDNGNPTLKPHVYSGQFDDLETVKKFIHDRLWMYFNSSTKAFLVAKGRKKGNEMTLKDAKVSPGNHRLCCHACPSFLVARCSSDS